MGLMTRIADKRGLTLSGTKTHVKQRFLPLTPLLMVSDVLWSPVDIFIIQCFTLRPEMIQGCLHINSVP